MKKLYALVIALCVSVAAHAESVVGIATGPKTATNYPMGLDIQKVCSNNQTKINVFESEGSQSNIFRIYSDKNVQYGIIQEDALVYQEGLDPKMMSKIKMVFPFFSTDIHVLYNTRTNISRLDDLNGKKIVVGTEGSGTWVTAQVMKQLLGHNWNEYTFSQKDGLKALNDGMVDAMIFVAGRPIVSLTELKSQNIKMLSIAHPKLDSFKYYTRSMIPENTYPWQTKAVQTYSIKTVLATYAFNNQYQKEIGDLVGCIARNLEKLQTEGHPKWRDVDVQDINTVQWPIHPAAKKAILDNSKRK